MTATIDDGQATARLDLPPDESLYVRLPDSFGRRFTVSIDTEEEFDWERPLARGPHGTSHGRSLPEIQRLLAGAGVKPLYLIDYPIAADPACVAILRDFQDAGACDIGTQLHPWVNPPFDEELSPRNSFAGNLAVELERAKLAVLTDTIEQGFGRRPTIYRAGRYGIGANTARLLIEAGYRIDCSVRPLHDYSAEGGPDFSRIRPQPYWVVPARLLEIPLSAGYTGLLRGVRGLYRRAGGVRRGHGLLARTHLLTRVALSPEGMPLREVLTVMRRLLDNDVRLLSLSFHSPSIEPGHTPYVRDAAGLRAFHAWWDGVFDFFARNGVEPASAGEIAAAAEEGTRQGLAPSRAVR